MIDVIIPAYNAHKTIERTLNSILMQNNKDELNIYIVNDASKEDYQSIIKKYDKSLKIKEIDLKENRGPGYARQTGIDKSNSDYIVFIDADDVFYSVDSIEKLKNSFEDNTDMVSSSFYEECEDKILYHEFDRIWVHGKMYKRKFLEENNIRFKYSYSNEDNGFNQLIWLLGANIKYIKDYTYVWKYNDKSITRKNNFEYAYSQQIGYAENITYALETAIKKNSDYDKIASLVYEALLYLYFNYITYEEHIDKNLFLKKFKSLVKIYRKYPIIVKNEIDERKNLFYFQLKDNWINLDTNFILNVPFSFNNFIETLENA